MQHATPLTAPANRTRSASSALAQRRLARARRHTLREHLASQPAILKLPVQHSAALASYCTAQHRVTPLLLPVPQSLILQVAWLNARDSFTQPSTYRFTVTAPCFSTCASLLPIRPSQHLLDLSPQASTDARSDVEQLSPEAQAVAVAYAAAPVDIQQRVRSIPWVRPHLRRHRHLHRRFHPFWFRRPHGLRRQEGQGVLWPHR